MGFPDDWADTVRQRRFQRWDERGGPSRGNRWTLENPRRASILLMLPGLAIGLGLGLIFDWLEAVFFVAAIIVSAFFLYQMLLGERTIYHEWSSKEQRDDRAP